MMIMAMLLIMIMVVIVTMNAVMATTIATIVIKAVVVIIMNIFWADTHRCQGYSLANITLGSLSDDFGVTIGDHLAVWEPLGVTLFLLFCPPLEIPM